MEIDRIQIQFQIDRICIRVEIDRIWIWFEIDRFRIWFQIDRIWIRFRVSFGDVLGGATAQAAISDCSERFISSPTRKILQDSIYMDDLMIGADENIEQKVKEVDTGLKKGNFIVKEWVKTGDHVDTKC